MELVNHFKKKLWLNKIKVEYWVNINKLVKVDKN